MIRKVEVKGLNNRLDGAWEFKEDLNIITGRNGSGKTTLLKLIWYLISGNIGQAISDISFRSVSIETGSFSLSIQVESDKGELFYQFSNDDSRNWGFGKPFRRADVEEIHELNVQVASKMDSSLFFPSFRRIEGGFARMPRNIPAIDMIRYEADSLSQVFADRQTETLQKAMSQISTEISTYDNHKFITAISTRDISDLLAKKNFDVYRKTNELHVKLSEDIKQEISETKPLDDASSVLEEIQERVEQVTKEQDLLLEPLVALDRQIPDIFQYKGIQFAGEGVYLGEEKEAIESDTLSAGEKQLLSFLCYNAFSENTAVFIDEPELSLHVDWQRLLLPSLLEQETGNQFFVATHSPFIYTKYPEREILLDEDRGGE